MLSKLPKVRAEANEHGQLERIRVHLSAKKNVAKGMIRELDLLCLTETKTEVTDTENWCAVNSLDPEHVRRHGGVAVLHTDRARVRQISSYSTENIQAIFLLLQQNLSPRSIQTAADPVRRIWKVLFQERKCLLRAGVLVWTSNSDTDYGKTEPIGVVLY